MKLTDFHKGIDINSPIKELRALPARKGSESIEGIGSIIILPMAKKYGLHRSGYKYMDFVGCADNMAYCRLSGCSDVIHLGGFIGSNNPDWVKDSRILPGNWSIDCLPGNGLLRIFTHHELIIGAALSSFEVFHTQRTQTEA
ncbi:MAG: hypothetical protein GY820_48300 [Gammaproteobacteria bacterium]|nr:hypothetical protein [Gammaproteobacteria bacterium]